MRLTCVVDNAVQRGSQLWGEHGLSFLIQTEHGNLLWDTGQSGTVWQHNWEILGLQPVPLHAVALSHAHYDHTGGLESVLSRHQGLKIFAHATFFEPRYSVRGQEQHMIGCSTYRERWQKLAAWHLAAEPTELLPGIKTTGTIAPRPYPQGASDTHQIMQAGRFVPDAYRDDISLVLQVPAGIVLLCGCCHAGLRNTLLTVRQQYAEPLVAIIGGTHLAQASEAEFQALIDTLTQEGAPELYLNHCTGERPVYALGQAFGERVKPCPTGTVITW